MGSHKLSIALIRESRVRTLTLGGATGKQLPEIGYLHLVDIGLKVFGMGLEVFDDAVGTGGCCGRGCYGTRPQSPLVHQY